LSVYRFDAIHRRRLVIPGRLERRIPRRTCQQLRPHLQRQQAADKSPDERLLQLDIADLGAVYLGGFTFRSLAREPKDVELKTCLDYVKKIGNRPEAFEDILWSLVNNIIAGQQSVEMQFNLSGTDRCEPKM
jgi:hypothetical protein